MSELLEMRSHHELMCHLARRSEVCEVWLGGSRPSQSRVGAGLLLSSEEGNELGRMHVCSSLESLLLLLLLMLLELKLLQSLAGFNMARRLKDRGYAMVHCQRS